MTVETAINIRDLNDLLPDDSGAVDGSGIPLEGYLKEDPAHARLIKDVIQRIFLGAGNAGFNRAIGAYENELNQCAGLTTNLQMQIKNATKTSVPIGAMIMYSGSFSNIPSNYALANGASGTPNMSNEFVYGTNTEGAIDSSGGTNNSVNVSHKHNADHLHADQTTGIDGDHVHNVNYVQPFFSTTQPYSPIHGLTNLLPATPSTDLSTEHAHFVTINNTSVTTGNSGGTGIDDNIPPYYRLAYIQRIT